jgi:type I restriction enzyme, S subunit
VANVKDGFLDLSDVKKTLAFEEEIDACRLQPGDILLTEGGDPDKLGRGTYWQGEISECLHQNHIFRIRFDQDQLDPAFLAAKHPRHQ